MTQLSAKTGQNFAVANLGGFSDLRQFLFEIPRGDAAMKVEGKVFLKQILALTSCEISLNNLPPKTSVPFYHKHRLNEEVYLFVRGSGEFQVDGCVFPVREGTAVRVDPDGERCIRNISDQEDLCWIVVQSRSDSYANQTIEDGIGIKKRVGWGGKQRI